MASKLAMMASGESALAFKAAGVDAYYERDAEKARETFKKLAKKYSVIFVADDLAEVLSDLIERTLEKTYPVVVTVPDANGNSEYAAKKLKEESERVLGIDVLSQRN